MEVTRLSHLAGGVQVAARWPPFQTLDSHLQSLTPGILLKRFET